MAFLNVEMSVPEIIEKFVAYGHPRVPVFKTHRDNIVGFVHAEDILRLVLDDADQSELRHEDIMHPPVVVPLTKKVDEMFDFFQVNEVRAAVCLNEFGGVEGFITMRGVLNFIFGDISGGSRATAGFYQEKDYNIYEVPGDMKLNDFDNLTNFGIEDPRMTTVAGFAFRLLDRLPREGDKVEFEDLQEVFHEAVADEEIDTSESAFVTGLAELQARKTQTGAAFMEFINENLSQFADEIAAEILVLAKEVTSDAANAEDTVDR